MTSSVEKALQLPEVLDTIAYWVPLFEHKFPFRPPAFYEDDECDEDFGSYRPRHLYSCTLVSRLWNTCFTPHLYHYFLDSGGSFNISEGHALGLQRNSRHIRRFMSRGYQRKPAFAIESLSRNIVGLFLYTFHEETAQLLIPGQGSQLKQFVARLSSRVRMQNVFENALSRFSCLEELDMRNRGFIANELVYRILSNCSGTLRELKIMGLLPVDEEEPLFFDDPEHEYLNKDPAKRPHWSLPHLKSLTLELNVRENQTGVHLPRLCPALESICITMDEYVHPIPLFTSILREHCHNLRKIRIVGSLPFVCGDYGRAPLNYTTLFKDSCGPRGLQSASLTMPDGIDDYMKDALLFHADTLVTLELDCLQRPLYDGPMVMGTVAQLLGRCRNLKQVLLWQVGSDLSSIAPLLVAPWGCQGLEQLVIDGYHPADDFLPKTAEKFKAGRSPEEELERGQERLISQNEYRNDGQGWFLKPGLEKKDLLKALEDDDWKRLLFEHMHSTSGIRRAKYVRLNSTEFFARDQSFDNLMVEMK
ncbi:MAG: hypothetical protein J3Q66DRAFT_397415 [Benniella sp.]|nr:MAG: hypothetical protein J3Q66DRAFT_397415 [Benniella sp.]